MGCPNRRQRTLAAEPLTVQRVVESFRKIATYEGEASESRRVDAIASLVSDADPLEARFVVRTALGHLRVGVGEGTVRDAITVAFLASDRRTTEAISAVERAHQVTSDFRVVARAARDGGIDGLRTLELSFSAR